MTERNDSDVPREEPSLAALATAIQRLEARVAALERLSHGQPLASEREERAPALEPTPAAQGADVETGIEASFPAFTVFSLVGQVCLVLCGAFLLRALTSTGVLPLTLGLSLGLVYATGWLGLTALVARRGNVLGASFYGVSAAAIAFPLIWEAATKFEVLAGVGSAVVIALITVLALVLAWRQGLGFVAWVFALAAIVLSFALVNKLHQIEPFAVVLLLLGAVTYWTAYTRNWLSPLWPIALAADGYFVCMTFVALHASSDGPLAVPESTALLLNVALLVVYLGSFVARFLLLQRDVGFFEIFQTGAALIVGFGGAAQIAKATESGASWLAGGALAVALACYAVAFSRTKLRWEHRRNFMFYSWLAFVLALSGCYLVVEGLSVLTAWCGLAIGGALLGARFRRITLHYHAAGYLIAAAYVSGLSLSALEYFGQSAERPWPELGYPAVLVLVTAVCAYLFVMFATVDPRRPRSSRVPRLLIVVVAVVGCGGVAVNLAVSSLGDSPPDASPALVAATRTVVLATAGVLLAFAYRVTSILELRWIVYPLLLLGGLKIVLEDLPNSTPTALFVAFGSYGLSLVVSPRLLRRGGREEPGPVRVDAHAARVDESPVGVDADDG